MSAPASVGGRLLQGAPIAAAIRAQAVRDLEAVRARNGSVPGIAVVLVGDDAPSRVYAARIIRNAALASVPGELIELSALATLGELQERIEALNADPGVAGVILQMPLPGHLGLRDVIELIDPAKDVDGIHPRNAGLLTLGHGGFVPSCAEAAVEILRRSDVIIAGRRAVVVGRGNVVGKPAALLLIREHATVTVCHRQTRDLAGEVRRADIVVVAAGVPGLITADMIAPGAVVIDCGINVVDGHVTGDVDLASVQAVAGAVTPVPGGVGPVTNAVLLRHLARAASDASAIPPAHAPRS